MFENIPNLDWMFRGKNSKEEMKKVFEDANNIIVENEKFEKIPDALIRFITKIFFGNINKEDTFNEYTNILHRSDVRNLYNISNPNDNELDIIRIFNNIEYIIFGGYNTFKKELEQSKKLDFVTGGEDMPRLETEEEAEKRMLKRAKSSSSSVSDKEEKRRAVENTRKSQDKVSNRIRDARGLSLEKKDKNKKLRILSEDPEGLIKKIDEIIGKSETEIETEGEGLKIMTPNQLLTRLPILLAPKKAGNNGQKLNNEIRQIIYLTVCSYHVTYAFQSESTLYSCLNVKELLARNRREI